MKHQIGGVRTYDRIVSTYHPRCHSLLFHKASAEGALRALPMEAQRQAGSDLMSWQMVIVSVEIDAPSIPRLWRIVAHVLPMPQVN